LRGSERRKRSHSPWQKGAWKTLSGAYDARCPAKLTSTLSRSRPQAHVQRLNDTPRKCLDFKTPAEAFSKLNQSLHFKRHSIPGH